MGYMMSIKKRYQTAKTAVDEISKREDLHERYAIDIEDSLIDLDALIEWAETALMVFKRDCEAGYHDERKELLEEFEQPPSEETP